MAVARVRHGKQFLITLGPLEKYKVVRSDFLSYFNDTEEYCVSIECYHVNNSYHLHAFFFVIS
jgi:hypothetical protein